MTTIAMLEHAATWCESERLPTFDTVLVGTLIISHVQENTFDVRIIINDEEL